MYVYVHVYVYVQVYVHIQTCDTFQRDGTHVKTSDAPRLRGLPEPRRRTSTHSLKSAEIRGLRFEGFKGLGV